jgi:hypothetical protein
VDRAAPPPHPGVREKARTTAIVLRVRNHIRLLSSIAPVPMTSSSQPERLPLSDIRVVDFSGNLAGPYCGQILADLGARVVKVERPGRGDPARDWAPPAWGGDGTLFLAANRGKRSLALELGAPGAEEVVDRLLKGPTWPSRLSVPTWLADSG